MCIRDRGKIGEKGKFKVAATYKYYGEKSTTNTNGDTHAGHLIAGAKVPFGSAYLSTIFTYGINGHLYSEQQTSYSTGTYGYSNLNEATATQGAGLNAQRAGLLLEGGAKINDTISVAAGVGYQATFNGNNQRGHLGYNRGCLLYTSPSPRD